MRKLISRLCLFLAPVVIVLLAAQLFFSSSLNRNAMYEFKIQILQESSQRKKIVLIGGSNCRYSYSSDAINARFPQYQVVNAATAAPYGLRFHLDYIQPYLNSGDVVILSPEYELLASTNGIYGDETLISIAHSYQSFYSWVLGDMDHAIHFLSQSFRHFVKMAKHLVKKGDSFNERIETIMDNHNSLGEVVLYPHVDRFSNYKVIVDELPTKALEELTRAADFFAAKQVKFIVNFPPVESAHFIQIISDYRYVGFLQKMLPTVEFLNTPSQPVYPRDLFYDSPYHLNPKGKIYHSTILAERLAEVLPLGNDF